MSKVLVTESYLEDIADAIRGKNGQSVNYTPAQMADAIEDIETGGNLGTKSISSNGTYSASSDGYDGYSQVTVSVQPNLGIKSISANGTYAASSDNKDGYSSVTVNVPNSYAAGDEGKVVSNGALVAQTSKSVTSNGTYDTTTNNEVVVNVSGGGSVLVSKSITQNGTYNPADDNADGYSGVTVNVSGGQDPVTIFKAFCTGTYQGGSEYPAYIYGTDIITVCDIDLLYDASQGGVTAESVADISNYDAIILQGIYRENRTSQYNTSILYENVELNHAYWAGMKDRNSSYICYVTFDSLTSFVLSGANKEVIIYGIRSV